MPKEKRVQDLDYGDSQAISISLMVRVRQWSPAECAVQIRLQLKGVHQLVLASVVRQILDMKKDEYWVDE